MQFIAFWTIAALAVLWEWDTLVCTHDRNTVLATGAVTLACAALLLAMDRSGIATTLIALGLFAVAALASKVHVAWCVAGLVYAAAILIAPVLLRRDANLGFAAILFLFVIVWLTDITAYFVGRAAGGPKLMPRVSPNKTWSGALGGTLAAVAGGVIVARQFGIESLSAALWWLSLYRSFASGRPRGVGNQASFQRQRRKPAHSRPRRPDGPAGRFRGGRRRGRLDGIAHGGFDAPARGSWYGE